MNFMDNDITIKEEIPDFFEETPTIVFSESDIKIEPDETVFNSDHNYCLNYKCDNEQEILNFVCVQETEPDFNPMRNGIKYMEEPKIQTEIVCLPDEWFCSGYKRSLEEIVQCNKCGIDVLPSECCLLCLQCDTPFSSMKGLTSHWKSCPENRVQVSGPQKYCAQGIFLKDGHITEYEFLCTSCSQQKIEDKHCARLSTVNDNTTQVSIKPKERVKKRKFGYRKNNDNNNKCEATNIVCIKCKMLIPPGETCLICLHCDIPFCTLKGLRDHSKMCYEKHKGKDQRLTCKTTWEKTYRITYNFVCKPCSRHRIQHKEYPTFRSINDVNVNINKEMQIEHFPEIEEVLNFTEVQESKQDSIEEMLNFTEVQESKQVFDPIKTIIKRKDNSEMRNHSTQFPINIERDVECIKCGMHIKTTQCLLLCLHCEIPFCSVKELRTHSASCCEIKRKTVRVKSMNRVYVLDGANIQYDYMCKLCGQHQDKVKDQLKVLGISDYQCDICQGYFPLMQQLIKHRFKHFI